MADLTITINPPATNTITITDGVLPHNSSHAPAGSDSLATWYAQVDDLAYVSGQIGAPAGVVFTTGDQDVSGVKNFYSRPTVNGSGVMLTGETAGTGYLTGYVSKSETGLFVSSGNTGSFVTTNQTGQLTGVFYPYSANPAAYVQGAVVRPSNTGNFIDTSSTGNLIDKTSAQGVSGTKTFDRINIKNIGFSNSAPIILNWSDGKTGIVLNDNTLSQTTMLVYANGSKFAIDTAQTGGGVAIHGGLYGPGGTAFSTHLLSTGQVAFDIDGSVGHEDSIGVYSYMNGAGSVYATDLFEEKISIWSRDGGKIRFTENSKDSSSFIDLKAETPTTGRVIYLPNMSGTILLSSQTGSFCPISDSITGITVNGSSTKTITLYQYDGSTLTASFTDQQGTGEAGEDLYIYSGSFNTSDGNLTLNRTGDAGTVIISLDGRYVTGSVVRPSETGSFVTNGQTGNFITSSQTGAFYPVTNPSGYITGVDLSPYATIASTTGISGYLQDQIATLNGQTGDYATGSVVRPSETGDFITTSQTGQFYAASNPQGFITGVDLSAYATTGYVTGVSGYLESLISASSAGVGSLNGLSGILTIAGAGNNSVSVAGSTITVSGSTGHLSNYVLTSQTGAFLTTGEADIRYVNATGDTINGNLEVTGYTSGQTFVIKNGGYIDFQTGTPAWKEGRVFYDNDSKTLSYFNDEPDVTVNIGQESLIRISNGETGSIPNGTVVYISGSQGNRPLGYLAIASSGTESWARTIGIATHDISTQGYVTTFGIVNGLNTTGFFEGDHLYLSETVLGGFSTVIPDSPNHKVQVGTVLRSHATQGSILVTIDPGNHLWNLHDVKQGTWTNDQILRYNQPSGYWESQDLNTGIFAQTSYVTGISGYQGGLISSLQSATGNLNTRLVAVEGVTGSFVTGTVVRQSETGVFLTTGAADSRYSRIPYVSEIYIDAGAMLTGVSGATPATIVATSDVYHDAYQFDAGTTGFAQFKVKLADYNLGNMRAKFDWTTSGASGGVVWGIQGIAVGDGEVINNQWGTAAEIADTFVTGTGNHISSATSAFSPSGSLQSGDLLYFRVYRSVANTGDTLAVNASLLGVSLQYTGNSVTAW